MAEWLRQQGLKAMICTVHYLDVTGSNLSWVKLGMCGHT